LLRRLAIGLVVLAALGAWEVLTGYFQLNAGEEAVILRLGRYARTADREGPHLKLPYPIETHQVVHVGVSQRREFGDVDAAEGERHPETAMQTGDNNIVLVEFVVQYRVGNAFDLLYRVAESDALLEEAAQAAMREVVGRYTIDGVIGERKGAVAPETADLLQEILDRYEAGIAVEDVELQEVQPPRAVREAFDDVLAASQDRNRAVNESEGYANEVVPRARGEASELLAAAQGYRAAKVADATGETARFLALATEYQRAPAITRKRLYLETMEAVLPEADKLIVEPGSGMLLPYLPFGPGAQKDAP
jgi:membrane protease subunit HflK